MGNNCSEPDNNNYDAADQQLDDGQWEKNLRLFKESIADL